MRRGLLSIFVGILAIVQSVSAFSISGKVTAVTGGAAIANAQIVIRGFNGGGGGGNRVTDTAFTDATGSYTFDSLAAGTYSVVVSKTGFIGNTGTANIQAANIVHDIALVAMAPSTSGINGKVTDSTTNVAIAGSRVVLRQATGGQFGGGSVIRDSAFTAVDGSFSFDSIPASTAGTAYSLVTSKAGYTSKTAANIVVAANQTNTVNIVLVKLGAGNLHVFVGKDSLGNAPLFNVALATTLQNGMGAVLPGATDAQGWATFTGITTGNYRVTATLAGFVIKTGQVQVTTNGEDTVKILLARATEINSKSLSGIVRTTGGQAIAGAAFKLQINGQGGATLTTLSSVTGDYAFSGIPQLAQSATIIVSKDGYASDTVQVTLGQTITNLNITLIPTPTSIHAQSIKQNLNKENRQAKIWNAQWNRDGKVLFFSAHGRLVR